MKDIDENITKIHRSSKTLFKAFSGLHDDLRHTFSWYYRWHLSDWAVIYHLIVLIVLIVILIWRLSL